MDFPLPSTPSKDTKRGGGGDAVSGAMATDDTFRARRDGASPAERACNVRRIRLSPARPAPAATATSTRRAIAALAGLAVAIAAAAGVLVGRSSAGGHAAPSTSATVAKTAAHVVKTKTTHAVTPPPAKPKKHQTALPAPAKTPVMVLNANGVSRRRPTWSRGSTASATRRRRSATPAAGASRRRSMYTRGFGPAARALSARSATSTVVVPLDGLGPRTCTAPQLVVYVGS